MQWRVRSSTLDFTNGFTLLLLLGSCWTNHGNADNTDVYYVTQSDRACHSVVDEGSTVDLVCEFMDQGAAGSGTGACRMRSLQWQRMGVRTINNVSDSAKYGVWEALPGWGVRQGEHISLLRIRDVTAADLGTYRCEIVCVDDEGRPHKAYHSADVCLKQPNAQYGICVSHANVTPYCSSSFWNDVCDLECTDQRNLFDGFECVDRLDACNAAYDGYCASRFDNGQCDPNCNSAECAWDGGDCITAPLKFADNTLALFLQHQGWSHHSQRTETLKELARSLSRLLRTIVRVLPDDWQSDHTIGSHGSSHHSTQYQHRDSRFTRVLLKLDNTQCRSNKQCFKKAERAAQYITSAIQNGWDPGIPIQTVAVLSRVGQRCHLENHSELPISVIDDPYLDVTRDVNSRGGKPQKPLSIQTWMLVVVVAGGLCLLILVSALTIIACRVKTDRPNESSLDRGDEKRPGPPHHLDITRIHSEKHMYGPPGVDV